MSRRAPRSVGGGGGPRGHYNSGRDRPQRK